MTRPACEPLEVRRCLSVSTGLDSGYAFSGTTLTKLAGSNVNVYQATPAGGDRTLLLAERYDDRNTYAGGGRAGYLTLVAVTRGGKLDTSFGTGGVAKTGRLTLPHFGGIDAPGLIDVDDAGRIYFADDTRVMRFRKNGTADLSFGDRGVMTYSGKGQPVALCDITPTDDGVMVATTSRVKGIDRFAVLKADGRQARSVWTASHDSGVRVGNFNGTYGRSDGEPPATSDDYQNLRSGAAQFARSPGGVVLVRLEVDQKPKQFIDYDGDGSVVDGAETIRQTAVVTRFDPNGRGVDVARREVSLEEGSPTALGSTYQPIPRTSVVLNGSGRVLLVQTGQQVLRFDLQRDAVRRYNLPFDYDGFANPRFQLLPDGNVWVYDQRYKKKPDGNYTLYHRISKFALDGTQDTTVGENGSLFVRRADTPDGGTQYVQQVFLGASGRLYVLAVGSIAASHTLLTLLRTDDGL